MAARVLNLCSPWQIGTVFKPETWDEFCGSCTVLDASNETRADALIPSCDAALTGWGTSYRFTPARIAAAARLRLIAHTAGSVKYMLPDADARLELGRRGALVSSGYTAIAINVAETTIAMLILALRRWPELVQKLPHERRPGIAQPGDLPPRNGQFLTGATIGLVGLSTVARTTLPLLRPFGCRVLGYDPYVSQREAHDLGVELTELDDVFARSDAVSVHVPELPDTRGLVGERQLKLLRDGAAFVNTARGWVVDHEALLAECEGGRISVALDVTTPEPLPPDSPLLKLPNVFITPHVAAMGHGGLFQIGEGALAAVRHVFDGGPPPSCLVPMEHWDIIA